MKTLGIASPKMHEIMLSFALLALLGVLSACSKSPESPEQSIREDKSEEREDVYGIVGVLDQSKAPSAPSSELIFEKRSLMSKAFESREDPQDPRPGSANHDREGISKLFEAWTGVAMPSAVEKLSYIHELRSHMGEANHHITFMVAKELAEELLHQIAKLDNPRYRRVDRPRGDIVLVVEPSSGRSVRLSYKSTYRVLLQPRWHRDDSLYIAIDLASGQVHCHRGDD